MASLFVHLSQMTLGLSQIYMSLSFEQGQADLESLSSLLQCEETPRASFDQPDCPLQQVDLDLLTSNKRWKDSYVFIHAPEEYPLLIKWGGGGVETNLFSYSWAI